MDGMMVTKWSGVFPDLKYITNQMNVKRLRYYFCDKIIESLIHLSFCNPIKYALSWTIGVELWMQREEHLDLHTVNLQTYFTHTCRTALPIQTDNG